MRGKKSLAIILAIILGLALVSAFYLSSISPSSLHFGDDTRVKTSNLSINKNANVSYAQFNVTGGKYQELTTFESGFDNWTYTLEAGGTSNVSRVNEGGTTNNGVKIVVSGGVSVASANFTQTLNLTDIQYLSFYYNYSEVGDQPTANFTIGGKNYLGFSTVGSDTVTFDVQNLTGEQVLYFYFQDGSNNGIGHTFYVDEIDLHSYPKGISIKIGNYSAVHHKIEGILIGDAAIQSDFNNSRPTINLTFNVQEENKSAFFFLPKDAKVETAYLKLSGFNDKSFANIGADYSDTSANPSLTGDSTVGYIFFNNTAQTSGSAGDDIRLEEGVPSSASLTRHNALGLYDVPENDADFDCGKLYENDFGNGPITLGAETVVCVLLDDTSMSPNKTIAKFISHEIGASSARVENFSAWMYNATGQEYPNNVSLDIGTDDGTYEWEHLNDFSLSLNQTKDLSSVINTYLGTCTANANNTCAVPILGSSTGRGVVKIDKLFVNYTNSTDLPGFGTNLYDWMQDECVTSSYNCTYPIQYTIESRGNISLSATNITYTLDAPTVVLSLPLEGSSHDGKSFPVEISSISNLTEQTCEYSLQYLSSSAYEVQNQSVSCTVSSITTATADNYIFWFWHKDTHGQEDVERRNITTVESAGGGEAPAGGGGGSGLTIQEILVPQTNRSFELKTVTGAENYNLIAFPGRPRTAEVHIYSTGDDTVDVSLRCDESDICDWVTFDKTEVTVFPSQEVPEEMIVTINIPDTVSVGDSYAFTVVGTDATEGKIDTMIVSMAIYPSEKEIGDAVATLLSPSKIGDVPFWNFLIFLIPLLIMEIALFFGIKDNSLKVGLMIGLAVLWLLASIVIVVGLCASPLLTCG